VQGKNSIIKLFGCITRSSQRILRIFIKIDVASPRAAGGHRSLVN